MSDPPELSRLGVVDLAQGIRDRVFSPAEVVRHFLDRIDARNPSLNAFVFVAHDRALKEAADSERRIVKGQARPLEGVPIAVKDDTEVSGMPTSSGTAMVPSHTPDQDAHIVAKLRAAGAIIIGKTNLPEFGTIAVTESARWGPCRNPWNPALTSGGSSGGSAAAVAAGLVPAAHGCDGGGSLRIPGSCCGVFTVKPSRGRISVAPYAAESSLTSHGFLTRSVLDNAVLTDLVQGNVAGDLFWTAPPVRAYAHEVAAGHTGPRLKIAWTAVSPLDVPVHPACAEAVREAAKVCADLGHTVDEVTPDWQYPNIRADFTALWAVQTGAFAESLINSGGDITTAEPHNRALYELGRSIPATTYLNISARLRQLVRRVVASWYTYDVVLTPTLAQPPLPVGWLFQHPESPLSVIDDVYAFTPFTPLINVTGQPASQLPMATRDGVPVGVQAIARGGDEAILYRLGGELERARPWGDRWPV